MDIMEIILGYGPILFSGAVVGAIASYLAPEIIKRLKANYDHKRIMEMHDRYEQNPKKFASTRPELASFFRKKEWTQCDCPNCVWMSKKMGDTPKVSDKKESAKKS